MIVALVATGWGFAFFLLYGFAFLFLLIIVIPHIEIWEDPSSADIGSINWDTWVFSSSLYHSISSAFSLQLPGLGG
jgi:hypothetical protein